MYLFCILLAAAGVGFAHPSILSTTPEPHSSVQDLPMEESCFYGKPSVLCMTKCNMIDLEPYCVDEDHCLCQTLRQPHQDYEPHYELHKEPVDPPTTATPPSPTDDEYSNEETQDKKHFLIVLLDWGRYFGFSKNENISSTIEPVTTSTSASMFSNPSDISVNQVKLSSAADVYGWGFQHYLTFLIVVLLCVLIVLEVSSCYRKRQARNSTENLFKNVPVPNK
uniref:Uncharacterized protein n=1 Tax=Graphocephala atropunctata TaxID=36148 RepID=A0A1B6MK97_9HEMI